MDRILNVFLLAAGLGERLRPITEHIPKPLLPILGKPLLQSILEKISVLPVNEIGINLHHKKEMIENWINRSAFHERVRLFPEEPILGTGGALKNAEPFLSNSTFLVHNADIVSNIDLEKLLEFHLSSKNLVTLAVHDCPQFNQLAIDDKGSLKGIKGPEPNNVRWVAFTGIAVYSPEFLQFLPQGESSIVDAWFDALAGAYEIGTLDVSGCYWRDIGTPTSYASTVFDGLRNEGEMVYIHPSVRSCKYVHPDGYVVIERESVLERGVSLRNCIFLPGSRVESESHYESCILGPDIIINLSESDMPGFSGKDGKWLIGTGGSDRKYYRVRYDEKSAVLMQCIDGDPNFQRHIEYTHFFRKYSIPVPELIRLESDKMRATFQDLGDLSLYSWLKCPREKEHIARIYRHVIDILILIHTEATEHVSECPLLQNRVFDYEHLRWETDYFMKRFVKGIGKKRVEDPSALEDEFHRLASKVDSFPKTIIHRDFQSQNIMITKGENPYVVDYQGARIGPPAYDVVSILWDPYYRLDSAMREQLIMYYISETRRRSGEEFSERDFRETLLPCGLQRHMQALGAYGFLSTVKGKKYFLKYIPEGIRLLQEDIPPLKDEYPALYGLITGLKANS